MNTGELSNGDGELLCAKLAKLTAFYRETCDNSAGNWEIIHAVKSGVKRCESYSRSYVIKAQILAKYTYSGNLENSTR